MISLALREKAIAEVGAYLTGKLGSECDGAFAEQMLGNALIAARQSIATFRQTQRRTDAAIEINPRLAAVIARTEQTRDGLMRRVASLTLRTAGVSDETIELIITELGR